MPITRDKIITPRAVMVGETKRTGTYKISTVLSSSPSVCQHVLRVKEIGRTALDLGFMGTAWSLSEPPDFLLQLILWKREMSFVATAAEQNMGYRLSSHCRRINRFILRVVRTPPSQR